MMRPRLIVDLRWRCLTALFLREDGQALPCVQDFPGGESTRYLSCDIFAGTVGDETILCLGESIESCAALRRLPHPLQLLSSPAGAVPPGVDLAGLALPLVELSVAPIFEFLATQDVKPGQLGVWLLVPASFSRDAAAVVSRALGGYGVRRVRYVLRHLAAAAALLDVGQWPEVVVADVEDEDLLVHRVTLEGSGGEKVLTSVATRTVSGFGWSFWVDELTAFLALSGRLPMDSEVRHAVDRGFLGALGAPYSSLVHRSPPMRLGHAEVDELAREMAGGESLQALKASLEGVLRMLSVADHVPWIGLGAPFAFNGLESIFQSAVGSDRPQLLREVPAMDRALDAAHGAVRWLEEAEHRRVTLASNASVWLSTIRRQSLELITANGDGTSRLENRRTVHQALKLEGQVDSANALPVRLLWGTNPDPRYCAPLGSVDLNIYSAPVHSRTVFLDLDLRRTPTSMAPRGSVGVRLGDNVAWTRLRPPPLATRLTQDDVLMGARPRTETVPGTCRMNAVSGKALRRVGLAVGLLAALPTGAQCPGIGESLREGEIPANFEDLQECLRENPEEVMDPLKILILHSVKEQDFTKLRDASLLLERIQTGRSSTMQKILLDDQVQRLLQDDEMTQALEPYGWWPVEDVNDTVRLLQQTARSIENEQRVQEISQRLEEQQSGLAVLFNDGLADLWQFVYAWTLVFGTAVVALGFGLFKVRSQQRRYDEDPEETHSSAALELSAFEDEPADSGLTQRLDALEAAVRAHLEELEERLSRMSVESRQLTADLEDRMRRILAEHEDLRPREAWPFEERVARLEESFAEIGTFIRAIEPPPEPEHVQDGQAVEKTEEVVGQWIELEMALLRSLWDRLPELHQSLDDRVWRSLLIDLPKALVSHPDLHAACERALRPLRELHALRVRLSLVPKLLAGGLPALQDSGKELLRVRESVFLLSMIHNGGSSLLRFDHERWMDADFQPFVERLREAAERGDTGGEAEKLQEALAIADDARHSTT